MVYNQKLVAMLPKVVFKGQSFFGVNTTVNTEAQEPSPEVKKIKYAEYHQMRSY